MTLNNLTKRWNMLGAIATAICTCIGGFLVLPPAQAKGNWAHFGVFVVTALIALSSVPIRLWESRRALKGWLILSVLLFCLGITGYFFYDTRMSQWTFEYAGRREIAGKTFSACAVRFVSDQERKGRSPTPADIVWEFGGNYSEVWPNTAEREQRLHILLSIYLALLFLFASAIVSVIQVTFCVKQPHK
jgi:hypothetical protein